MLPDPIICHVPTCQSTLAKGIGVGDSFIDKQIEVDDKFETKTAGYKSIPPTCKSILVCCKSILVCATSL